MADELTFDLLDADTKNTVTLDFISFYVKHYLEGSLEIISAYPVDYNMADINNVISQNYGMQPEELITLLHEKMGAQFNKIIVTMDVKYDSNGKPQAGSWEAWYQQQYTNIEVGN